MISPVSPGMPPDLRRTGADPASAGPRSRRERAADRLGAWIVAHPVAIAVGAFLVAAAAVAWSWDRVRIDANTDSLMGTDRPYVARYLGFLREFGDLEYAWIVVDGRGSGGVPRPGSAERAVDLLDARLRGNEGIAEVHSRVTAPEQRRLATWAMPTADLRGLVTARDALPGIASAPGAGTVLADADRRLRSLFEGGLSMPRERAEREAASAMLGLEVLASAAPGAPEGLGSPRESRYLVSDSGNLWFVGILPRKDFSQLEVIDGPLAAIRSAVAEVRAQVPEVEIGLTGKPVLQADEMATTNRDMNLSSIVGLLLCTALFMAVFRGVRLPLMALAAFLVGCALTYAAAALLFGRLNLLSIVFMLVLVGVGLDYGIHMTARYLEARRRVGVLPSVQHMMRTAVPSNLSGALTSAGVFLLAWFTEFQGLRELGVVSGVGLLLTLASIVLVLPALIVIFDHRMARAGPSAAPAFFARREPAGVAIDRTGAVRTTAVSVALAVLAALYGLTHLRFETNLLRLQAKGLDSVEWEHRVIDDSAAASWFGASTVDSMDQIPPLVDRLRAHPEVGQVRSVLDAVQPETDERAQLRRQFANAVEARPPAADTDMPWGAEELRGAAGRVFELAGHARREAPAAAAGMDGLAGRLRALADLCDPSRHGSDAAAVARASVDEAARRARDSAVLMADGARRTLRDALPEAVRAQMVSPNGRFLVMAHPAEDVWESGPLAAFVAALRDADPDATGVPMTVSESMASMERSFALQAVLATAMVSVLLWLDLRNAREALAAIASLAIGVAWTVGLMAALGTTFNLANFFAIPILIGLGIDSAIHITHRAHQGALDLGFGSTRRAVAVTALTTTIGFGALALAHHQGLRSLGVAMAVGSACCMVTAVWTLPALLRVAGLRSRTAPGPA